MSDSTTIFDATHASFETDVLQASTLQPIVVDFWAPWCAPCRSLGPILEKVIESYNGAVKLAKVNTDEQMALAGAFGIRSLPTVVLFKNGQMLDGFMGALPESAIREFLARHVGDVPTAAPDSPVQIDETLPPHELIEQLRAELAAHPDKPELKLDLVFALLCAGDLEAATAELDGLPAALTNDRRTKRLRSQLDFRRHLLNAPDTSILNKRIEQSSEDFEARDLLGMRLIIENEAKPGFEQFLHILRTQRNWQEGLAKKRLIAAFDIIEDEDVVSQYRRKMASVLF